MSTPIPSWYAAGLEADLSGGQAPPRAFCGGSLAVRDEDGELVARLDGARCPLVTVDGVVFVWFDASGRDPHYTPPALSRVGWGRTRTSELVFQTRPELVMRDLADTAHFTHTHGYVGVSIEREFYAEGVHCGLQARFRRALVEGAEVTRLPGRFQSRCTGVGFQVTEVESPGGLRTRHRVLPTPTTDGRCRVLLCVELRIAGVPRRLPLGRRLVHRTVQSAFERDVRLDAELWQSGVGPATDRGDATLNRYWDWVDRLAA